jgi:hypothetical protein
MLWIFIQNDGWAAASDIRLPLVFSVRPEKPMVLSSTLTVTVTLSSTVSTAAGATADVLTIDSLASKSTAAVVLSLPGNRAL